MCVNLAMCNPPPPHTMTLGMKRKFIDVVEGGAIKRTVQTKYYQFPGIKYSAFPTVVHKSMLQVFCHNHCLG